MKMYEEKFRTLKKKSIYGREKNLHTSSYIHSFILQQQPVFEPFS